MEFNFRLQHFKNICNSIGKPLDFWVINKYNHYTKRSMILRFNTVAEKRHFMYVFRNIFPLYQVEEVFNQFRILNIHDDLNLKALTDLFKPTDFREGFGEEFIMGDYRLSKDPNYIKYYKKRACFM